MDFLFGWVFDDGPGFARGALAYYGTLYIIGGGCVLWLLRKT